MKPKLLMRIAAILMLIHTIGHTFGALNWKKTSSPTLANLIRGMETERFNFMGRVVTLGSFYDGYGIIMIAVLLLTSITLWLLSNATEITATVQLLTVLTVFLLFLATAEYIYFFPGAAAFTALAALCSFAARIMLSKNYKRQFI